MSHDTCFLLLTGALEAALTVHEHAALPDPQLDAQIQAEKATEALLRNAMRHDLLKRSQFLSAIMEESLKSAGLPLETGNLMGSCSRGAAAARGVGAKQPFYQPSFCFLFLQAGAFRVCQLAAAPLVKTWIEDVLKRNRGEWRFAKPCLMDYPEAARQILAKERVWKSPASAVVPVGARVLESREREVHARWIKAKTTGNGGHLPLEVLAQEKSSEVDNSTVAPDSSEPAASEPPASEPDRPLDSPRPDRDWRLDDGEHFLHERSTTFHAAPHPNTLTTASIANAVLNRAAPHNFREHSPHLYDSTYLLRQPERARELPSGVRNSLTGYLGRGGGGRTNRVARR